MQHLVAMLVAGMIATGCGGAQRSRPARTGAGPGEAREIEVRFIGNRSFGRGTLLSGLSLRRAQRAGRWFDPYLVVTDVDRLRGFYLGHGFFDVQVDSQVERVGDRAIVTFRIREGGRAALLRIDLVGLPGDPALEARVRRAIGMRTGATFDYERYEQAKPRLVQELARAGYAHAQVRGAVAADRIRHEAVVRYEFEPGPLASFGEVRLLGVDGDLAAAARARIRFHAGDRYSLAALEETQALLYEMGRFSVVRIEPELAGTGAVVPVTIRVALAPRHELRLGGGLGLDPESLDVHGRAGYSVAAWPTPLTTTRLELRPAMVLLRTTREWEPRVEASAVVERLDLFVPLLRADWEVSLAYLVMEAYTSVGPRLRLGARYPIFLPELQVGVGWQCRLLTFRDLDPAIGPADAAALGLDTDFYRLGFYEQSLILDLRDRPLAPRAGVYAELRAEEGTPAAGGTFTYLRLTPEVRGYLPAGGMVAAARLRVGSITGDLPVTQRYFSGGASNHRGFSERRLSPVITGTVDGEPRSVVVGGGGLVESSVELRAPLGRVRKLDLGGVLFLDGGDVATRLHDIDPGHLHWAAGAGLRVATIIGPVRFDVGYRLNRAAGLDTLDRMAFHLNLGEAF